MPMFGLSTDVYAQREGKILLLKRAGGAATGSWYVPGGAVELGEDPVVGAKRELFEEAGLVPAGPLTLIGIAPMHVYGVHALQIGYACDCPDGEVVISHEHSAARWLTAADYRERYFGPDRLAAADAASENLGALVRCVLRNLDDYLAWLPSTR
jgi:8-oxo-dGTP pyrophosphatase MutT (NUDIX family)